jgi:hypothetical protein
MKIRSTLVFFSALTLSLSASWVFAQEGEGGDDLDVTMTLMPEGADLPDAVTRELELPRYTEGENEGEYIPSSQGVENSANGLETANAAREDGRAFGEAAAEAAQDNREEHSRGNMPDLENLLPDQVPDMPGPPDRPGPPDAPGAP